MEPSSNTEDQSIPLLYKTFYLNNIQIEVLKYFIIFVYYFGQRIRIRNKNSSVNAFCIYMKIFNAPKRNLNIIYTKLDKTYIYY